MSGVVVLGAQLGDEGKGKITDYLSCEASMVVRYQGGDNAGHTVKIDDKIFKLHLIPSGIFYKDKICIIGNGVVVNPKSLLDEIQYLNNQGVSTDNLKISDRAHIIFPYHIRLDELEEKRRGKGDIGTTFKGIGPCYRDKIGRNGIRMGDIFNENSFEKKLRQNIRYNNEIIKKIYEGEKLKEDYIVKQYMEYMNELKKYVFDTSSIVQKSIYKGEKVLFEGAQGTLLDIDYGTYPYVTSSHPISGGAIVGAGINLFMLKEVVGVAKAYTTRVGKGPFVTELKDNVGETIRKKGGEYGTTTGRPRRCGWLDAVALKYCAKINGLTCLAITKLDTLAGLDKIKICTGYKYDDKIIDTIFSTPEMIDKCEPIYEEFEGWSDESLKGIEKYDQFPKQVKEYIEKIEQIINIKVSIISIGAGRKETIIREDIFNK